MTNHDLQTLCDKIEQQIKREREKMIKHTAFVFLIAIFGAIICYCTGSRWLSGWNAGIAFMELCYIACYLMDKWRDK